MYENEVGLPLLHAGKVRELYDGGGDRLLMVATDKISAFDYVLEPTVPDKGAILTQLTGWWFEQLAELVPNHQLDAEVPPAVAGRAMWCEKLEMIPVECVARGYLTGSGWLEYQRSGSVSGVALPAGLSDGDRLPEPIFTPSTKAPVGEHDEPISAAQVADQHGEELAVRISDLTVSLYSRAAELALERGIIIADTKFEFGQRADGTVVLADEVLTPDSSRFWDARHRRSGQSPDSLDKQFVRNWLMASGWQRAGGGEPPELPPEIVGATRKRYLEAYEALTGRAFEVG